MKKFDNITTWLFNPFKYIAGVKALVIGLIFMIISGFLCYKFRIRLDGIIDMHYSYKMSFQMCLLDVFKSYLILSVIFSLFSFLPKVKARIIDIFGTIALANYPLVLMILTANLVKNTSLLIIALVPLLFTIWRITLFFNAIKVSFGLKKSNIVAFFIVGFIIAEIIGMMVFHYDFLFSKPAPERPKSKFELKAENDDLTVKERIAKNCVLAMNDKDFQTVISHFTNKMKVGLSEDRIKSVWERTLERNGKFEKIIRYQSFEKDQYILVFVRCKLEKRNINIQFTFNTNNEIDGLFIR